MLVVEVLSDGVATRAVAGCRGAGLGLWRLGGPLSFFALSFRCGSGLPTATLATCRSCQVRKNSLNIKFLGGIFLGHPGPRRRDIPDKNFMQVAFFCWFRQGVAGMSRDLGRDVPNLEKLYARKLWADFSYPILSSNY